MWEKYFQAEDPQYMQGWLKGANLLRKVNVQVLEDIQDYIMLDGFGNKSEA